MTDHKNQIRMNPAAPLSDDSYEIARLWVTDQGPSTAFINARTLPDPAMFGMLLGDAAHHGARAYAEALGISIDEASARIWEGIDGERDSTGEIETVPEEDSN
jgi:hypothetical protein